MRQPSLWGVWLAIGLLAAITASAAHAAPLPQDEPTPTPTPTSTGFGPTPTITPTLLPPPTGGGRVAVYVLVIRVGPDFEASAIGGLEYGEIVYPIGRSASGNWAAIEWRGQIGWVLASLVQWDPRLDFDALTIWVPPLTGTLPGLPTIAPTITSTPPASPTVIPTGTPLSTATSTSRPTQSPSATPLPPSTPSPEPTETPVPAVAVPAATEAPAVDTALPSAGLPWPGLLVWVGVTVPLALLAMYGWRFASGERELKRYAGSYALDVCPVCQTGLLHLEESTQRVFGVARVSRIVRCDTCRSVLRQVQPGKWRYTIDPYVNERLAADFNGQFFTDAQLATFAVSAMSYRPPRPEFSQTRPQELTDEEILAELEARIPPEEPERGGEENKSAQSAAEDVQQEPCDQ